MQKSLSIYSDTFLCKYLTIFINKPFSEDTVEIKNQEKVLAVFRNG